MTESTGPSGVKHVNGETGEVTDCMVMFTGYSDDGVAQFEVVNPVVYDRARGDNISVANFPDRTGLSFKMPPP